MMRDVASAVTTAHHPVAGHDYDHRVANVIVLAAFVTETAINEIAYWLEVHLTQPVRRPPDFDRLSIWKKWRHVPRACGASGFNESAPPWEDFQALIDLRNALAHAGPYPEPPHSALDLLDARGCTQPAMDWFESAMTVRTARWASGAASAMPHTLKKMIAPHIDLHNGGFSWAWGQDWLPEPGPAAP
jgi:hypothetical protein